MSNEYYHTFGMIKPDVILSGRMGKVLAYIESRGYYVMRGELQTLSEERAREFYREHDGKPFFDGLVEFMISGPVFPMVLNRPGIDLALDEGKELKLRPDAITTFRELVGSTDPRLAGGDTIRGLFGTEGAANAIHASDSIEAFVRENAFFFGG